MTEKTDYKTRFTFHLLYKDEVTIEELTCLNFFANLKEFGNPDAAVENSFEIEETFTKIVTNFQNYLKQITIDSLYKNYDENDYSIAPSNPLLQQNREYIFKLIDHQSAIRENGKLTDEKEVRVIYEKSISANDFLNPNPLSILPIWKDNEMQVGIRTLLKDLLDRGKYTSRFKFNKKHKYKNSYSINSLNL